MRREATARITRKLSKKKYCHGKNVYTYERFYMPIPKKFHEKIKPFLNKSLGIEVKLMNDSLEIVCKPSEKSPTG